PRRPPDRASTEAACLANNAVARRGPITTIVTSATRSVTAPATPSAPNGSELSNATRSRTPRLVNGPASASSHHAAISDPLPPGTVFGRPIPTRTSPPRHDVPSSLAARRYTMPVDDRGVGRTGQHRRATSHRVAGHGRDGQLPQ